MPRHSPGALTVAEPPASGGAAWPDPVTRDALEVIAEGLTQLAGFEVAAVSVVDEPGDLRVVAVAGCDRERARLTGTRSPVESLLAELPLAEDWGRFRFVAGERRREPGPGGSGAPAWHPDDLLVAPLRDTAGVLLGTLWVGRPIDGRRPDLPRRRILERYAAQAARAVMLAAEREQLAEQVRLLSAARSLVRQVSLEQTVPALLARIRHGLVECFRARGLWVHTFTTDGDPRGTVRTAAGTVVRMPHDLVRISESVAHQAWAAQAVGVATRSPGPADQPTFMTRAEHDLALAFLEELDLGSLLLVPLGAGGECLGNLVLTRRPSDPGWSDVEVEAALEIGRDLGRLLVNTRAFERERAAVRELRALDDYKGRLIATLSHELKSPLAAVLANLELLAETTPLDEESAAVLAAVDRGATRLVRVVEDLLLLARVGDPHSRLQAIPVDLRAVIAEVLALTALTAQARVETSFVGAAEDLVVLGAATELEILIGNLVSNALKYSDDDAPVSLEVARCGASVQVTCTDRGLGIDEADRARLFEEFFRSEAAEVRRRPGTGLGLAIVDRIVARHGGEIEVESELGVGTTFRLLLPAAPR